MAKNPDRPTRKQRWGRPPGPPETARSHRVVTFVTRGELEKLEEIAEREDRSLSAVTHRLLSRALEQQG